MISIPVRDRPSLVSRQLWSLWDMLEFNAPPFYEAASMLNRLSSHIASKNLTSVTTDPDGNVATITFISDPVLIRELTRTCEKLHAACLTLGARVTALAVTDLRSSFSEQIGPTWDRIKSSISDIDATLRRELTLVTLLALSAKEQELWEPKEPLFGKNFQDRFSSATDEVTEAAKCLALGRPTASAFHSIRCLEAGIRALSRCLGIPDPTRASDRSWFKLLGALEAEIDQRWPGSSKRLSGDGEMFATVHAALAAMQNPYRNATMHLDHKYTDEDARHIFEMVKGLMMKIAERCDEDGNPKA
jgi:hypothetical protein